MKISIVSPVYLAEEILPELVIRISTVMDSLPYEYEIILVEDGSPDKCWSVIEKICIENQHVKGVKLSRNFGQHYAITAGLSESSGDAVIVMDCDLQDNPKYIPTLIEEWNKGYEIVYTKKNTRKHSFFKNITAIVFNLIFNFLIENKARNSSNEIGAYSLLSRNVVNSFLAMRDYHRHYLGILRWLGFSFQVVEIEHEKRFSGESSYTLKKLINHAIDGITNQTDKLLRLTVIAGVVISLIAFISSLVVMFKAFFYSYSPGWASLFVLILFMGGLTILSIGITGIYVGKIFEQSKKRPLFIIEKRLN